MPEAEIVRLVVLRVGIAVFAAGVGGVICILSGRTSHRFLCALISFAAGALLAVTVLDIIPEASSLIGWPRTLAATTAGLMIFFAIGHFVYFICPACTASAVEEQRGYIKLGILLMITLALHSAIDGLAIAAGAASAPIVGILILVAVSYHKVPEGLALVSLARLAGLGKLKALSLALLIELTTGVGAFLGLLILRAPSSIWVGNMLALAAGSFLYVVGFALIKEMLEHERRSILGNLILGFVSIALLGFIFRMLGYASV